MKFLSSKVELVSLFLGGNVGLKKIVPTLSDLQLLQNSDLKLFFDSKKSVNFLKCTTSPRTTHTTQYQFIKFLFRILTLLLYNIKTLCLIDNTLNMLCHVSRKIYTYSKAKEIHRVLGSWGFQRFGFHLCAISKNSPNILLMPFLLHK